MSMKCCILMITRPPSSTRCDTACPSTPLFRSMAGPRGERRDRARQRARPPLRRGGRAGDRPARRPTRAHGSVTGVVTDLRVGAIPPPPAEPGPDAQAAVLQAMARSEEHTSELQSLMRISYAVFCLKKKKITHIITNKKLNTDSL